jgi:F-type H+-transporting ATPase subunit b
MLLASLTEGLSAGSFAIPEPEVDFDNSYLIQLGLFFVFILVMKPLIFDPMLKLFEEREKKTIGAKLAARRIDEKSATALAEYDEAMSKARVEANIEREKIRGDGVRVENEVLAKTRAETASALEVGRKQTADEAARARAALELDSAALAKELASRVLGREVQA